MSQRLHQEQTHRAGAKDQNVITGPDAKALERVDDAGQRLDERGLGIVDGIGQLVAGAGRHGHELGEAAGRVMPTPCQLRQ